MVKKVGEFTYFGEVLRRLLEDRGYAQRKDAVGQSRLAKEITELAHTDPKYEPRDYKANSISYYMRGKHQPPPEFPLLVDEVLGLSESEWLEFGLAYCYGQTMPADQRVVEERSSAARAGSAREPERRRRPRKVSAQAVEEVGVYRSYYEAFLRGETRQWRSGSSSGGSAQS